MIFYLQKLVAVVSKQGWKISVFILGAIFVAGWFLMPVLEGPNADLVQPHLYWWWFLITVTTVGYGDFFPVTAGGRIFAAVVVLGGIAAMGVVFTQLTSSLIKIRGAVMNGLIQLEETGHIVILGYHPGVTEALVREILADTGRTRRSIVLCFDQEQASENPMPEDVLAVRGRLTSGDVMERACVPDAARVVLHGRNDDETLAMAVAVCHLNEDGHVVAALEDLTETQESVHMVRSSIECVPRGMVPLIVEAVQDPGITRLYGILMSNLRGHSGYHQPIPEGAGEWRYGELLVHLKRRHDATLLAVGVASDDRDVEIRENPEWEFRVRGGMGLYYVAPRRISEIAWSEVGTA